ncbi:rho guanine nucleotide exchange factor 19 [Astyanax mexicanus]|uniref:rho guanine nucleotide exchange factor 19 n=1 Tax=Astyanax mexicanus TaxID=7994 RepID=UPI0020CAD2C0|nr:rho guanine nucleotide exchange factor 19 [Astyanax mexicanus]
MTNNKNPVVWESARPKMDGYHAKTNTELCQAPEYGAIPGIAEALRSVARSDSWSLQDVFLHTAPLFTTVDQKALPSRPDSPVQDCGRVEDKRSTEDSQEETKEEPFQLKYESKCIKTVPLYQEYWIKCMKADLHKVQHKRLADVVSLGLAGLPSPRASSPTSVSSPPGLNVSPYALWQEQPEVKRRRLLHSLPTSDIRHQEAIFELIVSETSYQKSLRVAVGLFQSSTELKATLPPLQTHVLFSNLKEVCKVSEGFLLDLETRLGQNVVMSKVGDIVLNHRSAFRRVYVPYVTNMMYQEALIAKLLLENKRFALTVKKLEKDPVCQRQTLKSFLVLPFQRITRLKLILENILKRTDERSADVSYLKQAIEAVREIVVECDNSVQRMKRTEELVSLGKLVDFGNVKSVPLIISGRYLIRAGGLKKLTVKSHLTSGPTVSSTDIYLHLFNDLLLLSLKTLHGQRFNVQDYATFPAHVRVEELKTQMLGLPSEAFLLRLTQNHSKTATAIILAAQTRLERETWIQLLSSQKSTSGV